MLKRRMARVLDQLLRTAAPGDGGLSDAQLLERYAVGADEAAFELLVWRHRRLVFGVCRRVLRDFHDAEDAFQATFLTLARKARSIDKREALASWLYKVAYRVALTAQADRARRAAHGRALGTAGETAAPGDPAPPPEQRDLWAAVDEEVSRLPERFRTAIVLCYFQGLTVEEAAAHLGCPRGTVASRLARARDRLRARLTRRGLTLTAGLVAAGVSHAGAAAAVPDRLVLATARAVGQAVAGKVAIESGISGRAAALSEEVLKTMLFRKLTTGALVVVAFAGVLLLGGGLIRGPGADAAAGPPPGPNAAATDENKASEKAPPPPATVTVSRPQRREAPAYEDFAGHLEAVRSVEIRARVGGLLQSVLFRPGADVRQGDLLFEIDPREYQATLAAAEADLTAAVAQYKFRKADWERANRMHKEGAGTEATVIRAAQELAVAEAAQAPARAAVERARKNLEACRVAAPIDGRVDRPRVAPGAQVVAGDRATILTTITALHPIGVRFEVDERSYLQHQRLLAKVKAPAGGVPLLIGLSNEEDCNHQGALDHFESRINPDTGSIAAHGILPNPDRILLPGMFVRVRMPFGKAQAMLAVPEDAIATDPTKRSEDLGRRYVLVVNARNVVERRDVKVGQQEGGLRVIEGGLRPDEWVVIGGAKGLQPGDSVEPRRKGPARD
jgi:RND family efflux transporter MFP subunit